MCFMFRVQLGLVYIYALFIGLKTISVYCNSSFLIFIQHPAKSIENQLGARVLKTLKIR